MILNSHFLTKPIIFGLFPYELVSAIIVDIGGVDVFDLLVKEAFRHTYLTDALLQFYEIVHGTAGFEALIIEGKTFNDVSFQPWC